MDKAKVIYVLSDIWKKCGDMLPALPVLRELPKRLHQAALTILPECSRAYAGKIYALSVFFVKFWLVVEGVTWLGPPAMKRNMMRLARCGKRVDDGAGVAHFVGSFACIEASAKEPMPQVDAFRSSRREFISIQIAEI